MFSEWTDPNDIDQYTSDIDGLMKDITAYSSRRHVVPKHTITPMDSITPESPVGIVANTPEKSAFEIVPGGNAPDGHPVGYQPKYNILYSGPPQEPITVEKFSSANNCLSFSRDHFLMLLFFAIVVLGLLLAQARATISQYENTIRLLFMNLPRKVD